MDQHESLIPTAIPRAYQRSDHKVGCRLVFSRLEGFIRELNHVECRIELLIVDTRFKQLRDVEELRKLNTVTESVAELSTKRKATP